MTGSMALVIGSLLLIVGTIIWKGFPRSEPFHDHPGSPRAAFTWGRRAEFANAIVGSLYLALGATVLALFFSLPARPLSEPLQVRKKSRIAVVTRFAFDVLWGDALHCLRSVRIRPDGLFRDPALPFWPESSPSPSSNSRS
jgi:phosphate transport system permease protein